jgi:hypothetical protein
MPGARREPGSFSRDRMPAVAEYNYPGSGNTALTFLRPAGNAVSINFNHNVETLLVGLNYRFSDQFH